MTFQLLVSFRIMLIPQLGHTGMELKNEKKKTAMLEQQLQQHHPKPATNKRSTRAPPATSHHHVELSKKVEELQDKLSFAEDCNETLTSK